MCSPRPRALTILLGVVVLLVCTGRSVNGPLSTAVADGTALDGSFGIGGVVQPVLPSASALFAAAPAPNGGLFLVGSAVGDSGMRAMLVVRLLPDGSPDAAFGVGGTVLIAGADGGAAEGYAVAALEGGGALVAGRWEADGRSRLIVARVLADGTTDRAFGAGGTASLPAGANDFPSALLPTPDGGVLVLYRTSAGDASTVRIVRLTAAGAPAIGFGIDGVARLPVSGFEGAVAAAWLPDGTLAVAGGRGAGAGVAVSVASFRLADDGLNRVAGPATIVVFLGAQQGTAVRASTGGIDIAGTFAADDGIRLFVGRWSGTDAATRITDLTPTPAESAAADSGYGVAIDANGRVVVAGTMGGSPLVARFVPPAVPASIVAAPAVPSPTTALPAATVNVPPAAPSSGPPTVVPVAAATGNDVLLTDPLTDIGGVFPNTSPDRGLYDISRSASGYEIVPSGAAGTQVTQLMMPVVSVSTADVTASVDAIVQVGWWGDRPGFAAVGCRMSPDARNGYVLLASILPGDSVGQRVNQWRIARLDDGRLTTLTISPPQATFTPARMNRLSITCSGTAITVAINDRTVGSANDGRYTMGGVGIGTRNPDSSAPVGAVFRNFVARRP